MRIFDKNGALLLDIQVDDSSYRYRAIMGDNSVTLYYSLDYHFDIPVGSYIEFQSERYTLWRPENFKKKSTRNFEYTVTFGSIQELLKKFKYKDLTSKPYKLKFTYTATPAGFIGLLVDVLNVYDSGWKVGKCIDSSEKYLSFNHEYCFDVLSKLASEFKTEWEIDNKTINLCKVEKFKNSPVSLSYGKGKGFKTGVARDNQSDKSPITLLYVQGGEKNIDKSKYGSSTLLLPKNQTLIYEGRVYKTDADGMFIIRADKPLSTIEEDSFDASDTYPKRVGEVTELIEVNAEKNFYDFIDNTIPEELDFSKCRIDGEKAIVIFQSGLLAGKEFDIEQTDKVLTGYVHKEKRFKLVPLETDGTILPNKSIKPSAGDKYAVFNISLPDAYICNNSDQSGASWDMFKDAARYFYENEDNQFSFKGDLDGIYARKKWLEIGGFLIPGGYVDFSDTQFQPEGILIRITGVKDYINSPYYPQIELSNAPVGSSVSNELGKIDSNEVITDNLFSESMRFTKRRWRDAKETLDMLNDALLHFSSAINPISIQTMSLLVGDESLQFRFVNNRTNPTMKPHVITYDSMKRILHAPSGILQHMTIGIKNLSSSHKISEYKFWDISEYNSPPLVDYTGGYYFYAKVDKNTIKGSFLLSKTSIGLEAIEGFYHLLVGVLNSEFENDRSFVELYGFTEILPGRITTERIVSPSGTTYFDLIKEEIGGKIKFTSGSSGLANLDEWAEVSKDISSANDSANKANDAVIDLNKYIDGAFSDGIITEAEAKAIEKYINVVNSTKSDVEATYTKLYANIYLIGAPKTNLLNAKVTFMGAVDSLLKAINDAISDKKTTEAEKQNVDAKYSAFNLAYSSMSQAIEAANKAIQDTLKDYSDEALKAANDAAKTASDATDSAGKANKAIGDLGDYVDGAFADGVIEESEAKAIEKYINTVNSTKSAVEATYNKLYINTYLSGTPKINLLNAKVTFFGAISNLITSINTAIKDGKTTVEEKKDVDSKFSLFSSAYASFNSCVEAANKAIQDTLKDYSDEALNVVDGISLTIKDNVAKNLGYDNFAAFEKAATEGKTIIDGGKINTALIEATTIITSQLLANIINANGLIVGNKSICLNKDGSGYLANENITWDDIGNLYYKGRIRTPFKEYTVPVDNNLSIPDSPFLNMDDIIYGKSFEESGGNIGSFDVTVGSNNIILNYGNLPKNARQVNLKGTFEDGDEISVVVNGLYASQTNPGYYNCPWFGARINNLQISTTKGSSGLIVMRYCKRLNKWFKAGYDAYLK